MPTDPLIGTAIQTGAGILNMIGQNKREERSYQHTRELMDLQSQNQMKLDKYGQQLQLETWEKTNYPAQVAMLKEAGLNPGLLYGKGGAGGVTGSQTGGSASGGTAPAPQPMPMEIGNALRMAAEIELLKAQTKKTEAEANVVGTTGVPEAQTRIGKMIQETANEKIKGELMQIESRIQTIEGENRQGVIEATVNHINAQANKLKTEQVLLEAQFNGIVAETYLKAIGQSLMNSLTESETELKEHQISLTDAQKQGIYTGIQQKWTELGLENRKVEQGDLKLIIETFTKELEAEYPTIGSVIGSIAKKAYNYLENLGMYAYNTNINVHETQDKIKK